MMKYIRGTSSSIVGILVQAPFTYLNVVINVLFMVIEKDIPTLLSMEDMVHNGFDISIQDQYVRSEERRQPMKMENYIPIHRSSPADVPYVLYTEQKARTSHRTYRHLSVRALQLVLNRANGTKIGGR